VKLEFPETGSVYGRVVVVANSSADAVLNLQPVDFLDGASTWPDGAQTSVAASQEYAMPGGTKQVKDLS
jgi:hypothetical protein